MERVGKAKMKFAFIKATEGSSFVDKYFLKNWTNANKTGMRVGAYHFFSFDSKGETQAEQYIRTVPKYKQALPPVIDVEFYANKKIIRLSVKMLCKSCRSWLKC